MTEDPATEGVAGRRATVLHRRRVVASGHGQDEVVARAALDDPDLGVRVAAVGALSRLGALSTRDVTGLLATSSVMVRRRVADAARTVRGPGSRSLLVVAMTEALRDPDPLVVVHAAWFLAERRTVQAVPALIEVAGTHDDTRCREAAVAALGALGDPRGLPVVLAALDDKPTVRRRATVALAGFDDPRVDAALQRSAQDRDWQVRQAADELLDD
jgi:HEAT repeat protein